MPSTYPVTSTKKTFKIFKGFHLMFTKELIPDQPQYF